MKNIWKSFLLLLESISRARIANQLVRAGKYDEARKLFEKDLEVHP